MSLAAEGYRLGGNRTDSASPVEAAAPVAPLRPLSLRLNFSWVLAGNLVRAVCRYGMLLALVHFCGLAAAGKYALAVAVCTPIWTLALLGLRGALITDARQEYRLADYLAVRLLASAAGLIVVAGVIVLGNYDLQAASVIGLVALARLFEGIADIFRGRLQQRERMDRVAIGLTIQGLTGLGLMIAAGWCDGRVEVVVASLPLATLLTLLAWDIPSCSGPNVSDAEGVSGAIGLWRQPLEWRALGRLSVVALPVAAAAFLVALLPQLPKYVIGAILGEEAVAIFALITYWITLGMMVVTALGNAATPRLARFHAAGNTRAFVRLLLRLVGLVGVLGATGVVAVGTFGSTLAEYLGRETSDLPRLALALSVFAFVLYLTGPLGRALGAMRRFWTQTALLTVGIAIALAILPWAVANHGLVGAAEAMTIAMAAVVVLTSLAVWHALSHRRDTPHPSSQLPMIPTPTRSASED